MSTQKSVASSDQFGSYGDRLRQKLINRLAHKTKNLTTVERTVSKSDHTPSVSEVYQTTTVLLNRLSPERQLNPTDDSTTEVAPIDLQEVLTPNEVDAASNEDQESTVNQINETDGDGEEDKNLEDFSLLWCDSNVNATQENRQTKIGLRKPINFLRTFETSKECKSYIQRHAEVKIVLVVSGTLGLQLVPEVHHLAQVNAVYVCCRKKEEHSEWSRAYDKCVVTLTEDLVEQISTDQKKRNKIQREEVPISVLESTHQSLGSDFMWFQLIIEVLLRLGVRSREWAFKELIDTCKQQYFGNIQELVVVNELQESYEASNAVNWYTRDTFIYRMLNTALRRQDADVLVKFSFLIQHIHEQLKQEQHFEEETIHVYRGQLMNVEEAERLRTNEKRFISINTFFSTTHNRELALIFSGAENNTDIMKVSVLFEIQIDTKLKGTKPFADISRHSAFGDTEQEVLFMVGSVFQLTDISRKDDDNVWMVKMVLAGEEENELKPVFESIKNEIEEYTTLLSLGNIFEVMGKYTEAEKYYKRLLNSLPDTDPNISTCDMNLGIIASRRGDYDIAVAYLTQALELELKSSSPDESIIADIYMNHGNVSREKGELDRALENYSKSLEVKLKIFGHNHLQTAMIHNNIGNVYYYQKCYDFALSNYNECLQIRYENLPKNHPLIASVLNNIDNIYLEKKEYELAMTKCLEELSIQLACIPNHIHTADTYHTIGVIYQSGFQNYSEALINFEKALEIEQISLPTNHPSILDTQDNVRLCKEFLGHG